MRLKLKSKLDESLRGIHCSLSGQKKNGPCKLPRTDRFRFFQFLDLFRVWQSPLAQKVKTDYLQPQPDDTAGAAHPQPDDAAGAPHPPPQALPLIAPPLPIAAPPT